MSLDQNSKAELLALKEKREALNATPTTPPVVETPQAEEQSSQLIEPKPATQPPSMEGTPAVKKDDLESAVPPKESTKPKEEPKKEEVDANKAPDTAETADDLSEPEFDLDLGEEEGAKPKADEKSFDFKKLGSALNLEASTQEEFISKVNEKFSKLKDLEETTFNGVPDDLKQAIEIAKKGGDWKSYTSSLAVDVDKLDPLALFDREFERVEAQRFKNPDGSIDYDKLDEELNSIPDGIKRMQGNAIKQQISSQQQARQAAVMAAVAQSQEKFQKSLGEAVRELSSVLPKESFGVTFEPKHSSYLYEGIANGSLIKKHLGNIEPATLSKLNAKKLMSTIALAEWAEKISDFRFKQGKVSGKKEILSSTQNAQIKASTTLPTPSRSDDGKPLTSAEKLEAYKQSKMGVNSL